MIKQIFFEDQFNNVRLVKRLLRFQEFLAFLDAQEFHPEIEDKNAKVSTEELSNCTPKWGAMSQMVKNTLITSSLEARTSTP